MDLAALQTTLRQFAAERSWQPFHTPKNLAMALMVEAAELAEIFQWMTPEQSQSACADHVTREQVGDEVADVLFYLVQLADRAGIDLKRAVTRKLAKNAKKYPPQRPGMPAGESGARTIDTHVLVDWENVQPSDADVRTLVPDVTDVWLFHGPAQTNVGARHASFGDRATPVKIARAGKNALDFHLSFYMGYIAARHPDARFVVISNDKGYRPMLEHAAELGFAARHLGFTPPRRSPKAAAKKTAPKKASPHNAPPSNASPNKASAKSAAAKNASAKTAPAPKPPPTADEAARAKTPAKKTASAAQPKPAPARADPPKPPAPPAPKRQAGVKAPAKAKQAPHRPRPLRLT